MNQLAKDFTSQEQRTFRFKIGRILASSLAGFIAGVIVTSIVWSVGIWYVQQLRDMSSVAPTILNIAPSKK